MGFLSSLGGIVGNFFGPVGAAVGSALGGAIDGNSAKNDAQNAQQNTNAYNAQEAETNRRFLSDQATINRDFQAEQSSTAYQRATADMKAAGLNPMLAYSQGGASTSPGSSVGSGSQATSQNVHPQAVASAAQAALSQSQIAKQQAEIRNLDAQADLYRAQEPYVNQQTTTSATQADVNRATVDRVRNETLKVTHEIDRIDQDRFLKITQGNRENSLRELYDQTKNKIIEETVNLRLSAQQIRALTAKAIADSKLSELQIPGAINRAMSDNTWFGQNIRPYIDDAGKLTQDAIRVISSIPQLARLLK